jgi:hypothetical protein
MSGKKSVRFTADETRQTTKTRTRALVFPAGTILEPTEPKVWTVRSATKFLTKYYKDMFDEFGTDALQDDFYADIVIPGLAQIMNGKPIAANQLIKKRIDEKNDEIFDMLYEEKDLTLNDIADWILMTGGGKTRK